MFSQKLSDFRYFHKTEIRLFFVVFAFIIIFIVGAIIYTCHSNNETNKDQFVYESIKGILIDYNRESTLWFFDVHYTVYFSNGNYDIATKGCDLNTFKFYDVNENDLNNCLGSWVKISFRIDNDGRYLFNSIEAIQPENTF